MPPPTTVLTGGRLVLAADEAMAAPPEWVLLEPLSHGRSPDGPKISLAACVAALAKADLTASRCYPAWLQRAARDRLVFSWAVAILLGLTDPCRAVCVTCRASPGADAPHQAAGDRAGQRGCCS